MTNPLFDSLQSKIVRVLNLWQKNQVFPSGVVQPLLDLAADSNNPQQWAKSKLPKCCLTSCSVLGKNTVFVYIITA